MSLIDLLLARQPNQLPTTGYGSHIFNITNDSYNHGGDIRVNPQTDLHNKKSIHSNGTEDTSYSLNGSDEILASRIHNTYNIPDTLLGYTTRNLATPSTYDLDGATPSQYMDTPTARREE
jgi:hypothetical protein